MMRLPSVRSFLCTSATTIAALAALAAGPAPATADELVLATPIVVAQLDPVFGVETQPVQLDAPGGGVKKVQPLMEWGKGKHFGATFTAEAVAYGKHLSISQANMTTEAAVAVKGRIYDKSKSLIEASMSASTSTYASNGASAGVYVLGNQVFGESETHATNATASWTPGAWEKTFIDAEKSFPVIAFLKVKVRVKATGAVGIKAKAQAPENRASLWFGPYADVVGLGSVGTEVSGPVGLASIGAGFTGSLRLIDVSVAFTSEVTRKQLALGQTRYAYDLEAVANFRTLDGKVGWYVEGEVCGPLGGLCVEKRYDDTIFSWSGKSFEEVLWNASGGNTVNDVVITSIH